MDNINVLSLFDGISGARQALNELGITNQYLASEVDKYAIQIAKTNHPSNFNLGDVKRINITSLHLLGIDKVDLLIGGSPCQDLSIAKKDRKGLEGSRSGLFFEYVRLLHELKPKWFILENVASMSQLSKDKISEELGVKPILINSALLTAQQRKRYYWVGRLDDDKYSQIEIPQPDDKGILLKDIMEYHVPLNHYINPRLYENKPIKGLRDLNEKSRTLLASSYKGYGNDGTTCIRVGCFNKGGQGDRVYSTNGKSVSLSANGGGRGAKTGLYAMAQRGRYNILGNTTQQFETSFNEKSNSLTRVQKDSLLLDNTKGDYTIRKLTVDECCRLQGFPDGYCNSVSRTQGYKALGNSFTVPVIKHLMKQIWSL